MVCEVISVIRNFAMTFLGISGAKKSRKLKIYSRKDLGQIKKCECELVAFLKAMIPELSLVISCILYLFFATEMT